PGSTSTSLASSPSPSVTGQAVTLTATVSPQLPAVGAPGGTVTFNDGTTPLGTVTLVNGSASLVLSTLAAATHSITAVYSGSPDSAASTSTAVTQTVNQGSTGTTLSSSAELSVTGQAVTLTVTVSAVPPATGMPTGTVTFSDGTTSLGTATLVSG